MNRLIKFLYKLYPIHFYECVSSDFLGQLPKPVRDNALQVFEERRDSLVKYFLWQAHVIQRRAVNDVKKADFYLGMLTNIKIYLSLIETGSAPEKNKSIKEKVQKTDVSKEISIVDKFVKKSKS